MGPFLGFVVAPLPNFNHGETSCLSTQSKVTVVYSKFRSQNETNRKHGYRRPDYFYAADISTSTPFHVKNAMLNFKNEFSPIQLNQPGIVPVSMITHPLAISATLIIVSFSACDHHDGTALIFFTISATT